MQYDITNKAVVYVENGIFNKAGVEKLQALKKPIIKVKANVDGKDVEIALYFKMVFDEVANEFTNEYYQTKTGSKMLKGKVELPYLSIVPNLVTSGEAVPPKDEFDDEIPF